MRKRLHFRSLRTAYLFLTDSREASSVHFYVTIDGNLGLSSSLHHCHLRTLHWQFVLIKVLLIGLIALFLFYFFFGFFFIFFIVIGTELDVLDIIGRNQLVPSQLLGALINLLR